MGAGAVELCSKGAGADAGAEGNKLEGAGAGAGALKKLEGAVRMRVRPELFSNGPGAGAGAAPEL